MVEYEGGKMAVRDLADKMNRQYSSLLYYLKKGKTVEEALSLSSGVKNPCP